MTKGNGASRWKARGTIVTLVVLASTITLAVVASMALIPPAPCAGVQGVNRVFDILADLNGYNGSVAQGGMGPFMTVQACDTVVFNLVNRDVQAHGLSVEFYAAVGVEASHQETAGFQFLAYKPGDYRVYCNTVCSVHNYMQHALLTVTCCPTGCCT